MRILTQRSFTRNHFQAPILFTRCNGKEECRAVMYNSSVGGMYFESDRPMSPGEGVLIRMADFAPDPYWPEASDHYVGEVRWCEEKAAGVGEGAYGIGVRFVATVCKDCGHMSLEPASYTFSNVVEVCPECLAHLETLSEGKLKQSIRNHLIGNVV
jgi:hypothetical protein